MLYLQVSFLLLFFSDLLFINVSYKTTGNVNKEVEAFPNKKKNNLFFVVVVVVVSDASHLADTCINVSVMGTLTRVSPASRMSYSKSVGGDIQICILTNFALLLLRHLTGLLGSRIHNTPHSQMVKHIFYLPASYASVIHAVVGCLGLVFPLYIGVILHPRELLTTHCGPNHYEYWPSISTTIGDMMPERQIWRTALLMAFPFRVVSSLTLFYVFWTKGSAGLLDMSRFAFKPLSLFQSSAFLAAAMLWVDLWRWLAAFVWTMVVSSEIHDVHNFAFLCYIVLSVAYHVTSTALVWRNRMNSAIYSSPRDGICSFATKFFCLVAQITASACVIIFYLRHQATCADGSYSLANMFEWTFALVNLSFDATVWFDIQHEGIWLSGSPSFYHQLWTSRATVDQENAGTKMQEQDEYVAVKMVDQYQVQHTSGLKVEKLLFPGSDVIVHTFSICAPPSDTLMWLCDTFFAYQYFGGLINCLQHMYFQPLVAMSVTWEVVAGFSNISPIFLMFPSTRRIVCGSIPFFKRFLAPRCASVSSTPMYVLFYLIVTLSHLHQLVTGSARKKILACGVSPFFLHLAFYCRFLYPNSLRGEYEEMQECRRMIYTIPLGLIFNMVLRVLHISLDPLYVEPFYGSVFGIGLGLFFTLTVYRHAMFHGTSAQEKETTKTPDETPMRMIGSNTKKINSYLQLFSNSRPVSPIWSGVLHGALYIFSLLFLTCANVLPRFVAVEPMPGAVIVICTFLTGVVLSPSILPICSRVADGSSGRGPRSLFKGLPTSLPPSIFACFVTGSTLLMLYGTRQSNFAYTSLNYTYNQPDVSINDWDVQNDFSGSKNFAFLGGLGLLFCAGVLYPVVMELTWVHRRYQYAQRGAQHQRVSCVAKLQFPLSFELVSFIVYGFFVLAFALCMCYPFVPGGELFRERTRQMIMLLVILLTFFGLTSLRRMRDAKLECTSAMAYAQRCLPLRMIVWVLFILLLVLSVRTFRAPANKGYPQGDPDFAEKFQPYILCAHERLLEVKRARNILTDDSLKNFEKVFHQAKVEAMRKAVRDDIITNGCYEHSSYSGRLASISAEEREAVYNVAEALTDFSGAIWTVHFALDNMNTDSLWRLTNVVKDTGVGVIGFLESDAMHIHNGNRDLIEYISYYLGFPYVDNGPTPLDNTFGCAMASRYPIVQIHRYVLPSPLGEMACMIHAKLDVMGVYVHTYVGHFGNTEHDADGLLQSQFLGKIVKENPGPSMWLGYVVSYPGNPVRYGEYSDPNKPGYLRDAAHHIYTRTPWSRLWDRGGYDEKPPPPKTYFSPEESTDFNVEAKIPVASYLEKDIIPDASFRRTPEGEALRTFYFNNTNRYSHAHPRFEFLDRYCQYCFFKTGQTHDELPQFADELQVYAATLFDWWRVTSDPAVSTLSDTEVQVVQLMFLKRDH
eukprot:gene8411-5892_t